MADVSIPELDPYEGEGPLPDDAQFVARNPAVGKDRRVSPARIRATIAAAVPAATVTVEQVYAFLQAGDGVSIVLDPTSKKIIISNTVAAAQVVKAPAAPTNGQVNDVAKEFTFTVNPLYPSYTQYKEVGRIGTVAPAYLSAATAYQVGNVVHVMGLAGSAKQSLSYYVAGSGNVPDGKPLTNLEAFSGTAVVTPPAGDTTPPAVTLTVPAAGAVLTAGAQVLLTATATDNVAVQGLSFSNGATGTVLGQGAKNGNTYTLAYTPTMAGPLTLTATATDAAGNSQAATVNVTVQAATVPVNAIPVANAGSDTSITLPTNQVVLQGSGTDSDGTIASYAWRQVAGAAVSGMPSSIAQPVITFTAAGTYQFGLITTDNKGATSTEDFVVVTVNAAPAPGGGTTNTLQVNSTLLSQNVVAEDLGYVERVSPMSSLKSLAITGAGPVVFTQYSDDAQLDMLNGYVTMDGGAPQYLTTNASGNQPFTFQNPGGTHVWEYTGGSAQKPSEGGSGNVLTGGVLTKVDFAAGQTYTLAPVTKATNGLFIIGDSISVSVGASTVDKGWGPVLRGQLGPTWDVAFDSYGYRGLLPAMAQATYLNALKQQVSTYFAGRSGRKVAVLDLGTNNYGLTPPLTSAADAATIAGAILDALSSLGVEVALKTPISRYDKTGANSPYNNTLANYTNALLGLGSSRPNVGFMDATSWLGQADLATDKLHPSDQGHPLIAGQYFSFINRNVVDNGVYDQRFYAGGNRYALVRNTQRLATAGFAVAVRFVHGANTGYQQLAAKASVDAFDGSVLDGSVGLYTYQGAVHGSVYAPGGTTVDISLSGIAAGGDYLALVTYAAGTGLSLYLLAGGVITKATGATVSSVQASTDAVSFGAVRYINPPGVGSRYLGYLDHGAYFTRGLSDSEARAYLNAGGVTPSGLLSALAVDTDFKSTSTGTTAKNTAVSINAIDLVQLDGAAVAPPVPSGPPATGGSSQPGITRANDPSYIPSDPTKFVQGTDNGGQAYCNTFGATLSRTFRAGGTNLDVLINRFPEGGNMTVSLTGFANKSASCASSTVDIAVVGTTFNGLVYGQQYTLSITKADQALRQDGLPTFITVAGDNQY